VFPQADNVCDETGAVSMSRLVSDKLDDMTPRRAGATFGTMSSRSKICRCQLLLIVSPLKLPHDNPALRALAYVEDNVRIGTKRRRSICPGSSPRNAMATDLRIVPNIGKYTLTPSCSAYISPKSNVFLQRPWSITGLHSVR
jgi:hypothetical protein